MKEKMTDKDTKRVEIKAATEKRMKGDVRERGNGRLEGNRESVRRVEEVLGWDDGG